VNRHLNLPSRIEAERAKKLKNGMNDEIKMIAMDQIRILNPRVRDKKKFELIVQSIRNLGLKKPIQVSLRSHEEGNEPGYDLVCGQGRIEAFRSLGHTEIPAIVVQVSKEDRLLRSLVENMARRFPSPLALMHEIERLKAEGYSNVEIGKKLDIADTLVGGFIALKNAGEERLLDAALSGRIPLGVAIDIAKTDTVETQRGLLKAYESNQLNQASIRTLKRLIDQRRFIGKHRDKNRSGRRTRNSAENLVKTYRREAQKKKLLIKKAKLCDEKVAFIVAAFKELFANENFVTLLRAEGLFTVPKNLWDRLEIKEAA
jgi:ParB family transcriptional regulator, chromosome partitioning protein